MLLFQDIKKSWLLKSKELLPKASKGSLFALVGLRFIAHFSYEKWKNNKSDAYAWGPRFIHFGFNNSVFYCSFDVKLHRV